jgi:hypothetical protein
MDIINKVIGVIIAFVILGAGPLINYSETKDTERSRNVLNEMANFINKVSDTGKLTDLELADFYLGVSSHGATMDAKVQRYVKVVNPDGSGGTYTSYTPTDSITKWNKGDMIKVTVTAIEYSGGEKLLQNILGISPAKFDNTLAGMIRN